MTPSSVTHVDTRCAFCMVGTDDEYWGSMSCRRTDGGAYSDGDSVVIYRGRLVGTDGTVVIISTHW